MQAFLSSIEPPSKFLCSTLSVAALSSGWAADFLLADVNEGAVAVHIQDGAATFVQQLAGFGFGSYSFPPALSAACTLKFAVINVGAPHGDSLEDALAKELSAMRCAKHSIILAIRDGRVSALAQGFWDTQSLEWRQGYRAIQEE